MFAEESFEVFAVFRKVFPAKSKINREPQKVRSIVNLVMVSENFAAIRQNSFCQNLEISVKRKT